MTTALNAIRHRRAQRDQHVHVGAAAAQRMPGADVEAPADPELHRRRQRELQPARQQVGMRAAEPTAPCASIGTIWASSGSRQQRRDDELALQGREFGGLAGLVALAVLFRVAVNAGAIAGAGDRGDQLRGVGERADRSRRSRFRWRS